MSLLDMKCSSRILIEEVIKHHFKIWLSRFPEIEGIVFDEIMNERYTEEDWDYMIEHPNRVHIYWWDSYYELRIYIHKYERGVSRPNINWGYVRYTGNHINGYSVTLKSMIKEYGVT